MCLCNTATPVLNRKDLKIYRKKYAIPIKKLSLLLNALTHKSYRTDGAGRPKSSMHVHNERLEFLGDAVLGLVITAYLLKQFLKKSEGVLSKIKSYVVSRDCLYRVALTLGLDSILLFSNTLDMQNSRSSTKLLVPLGNAVEAIIGAVYLDGRYKVAEKFVLKHFVPFIEEVLNNEHYKDYKSILQHYTQSTLQTKPVYQVVHVAGPDHDRRYEVIVKVDTDEYGPRQGSSKKQAEQSVAALACETLNVSIDLEALF